jgi:hypothetical protein
MNQKTALAVGALAGVGAAFLLGRKRPGPPPVGRMPADPGADQLRRQLAEARQAGVDEGEFAAAGMGAETILTEEIAPREPPPENEFEAMRRRVHEEARAAAEEMRRRAETPETP